MIIGPGNSGKSTLAKTLSTELGLPVKYLDRYFWLPNWVKRPSAEWQTLHKKLISEDSWIIEGDYIDTMGERIERAEAIIFLNMPKHVIIPRSVYRVIKHKGKSRPEVAEGNSERFGIKYARFIKVMTSYDPDSTLKLLSDLATNKLVIILHTKKEVDEFVKSSKQLLSQAHQ